MKNITFIDWLSKVYSIFIITLILLSGCVAKSESKDPALLLKSTDEDAQAQGALLLYDSKQYDSQFIPLLIDVLKTSKSSGTKCNALLAISCYKEKASTAVPEIIRLLNDRDKTVVSNAIGVLGKIKSFPIISLLELQKIAKRDKELRGIACKAIGEFGSDAKYTVAEIISYVNDPDIDTRAEVRQALKKITGNKFWISVPETAEIQPEQASTFKPTQFRFENYAIKTIPEETKKIYITRDPHNGREVNVRFENIQYDRIPAFISFLETTHPEKSFLIIHGNSTNDFDIIEIIRYCTRNDLNLYQVSDIMVAGCKYLKYISVIQEHNEDE